MRHLISPFVVEQYQANLGHGSMVAASLFVDLSGFSRMADVLAQHGQHGAEVLADVMRAVFDPLVKVVYAQGGFVVGYAGDAFTAVFPEDQARDSALMRSLSAVWAMQSYVRTHSEVVTPFGRFPIFIKAGMGFGETRWQIFRSTDGKRATFCFRGDGLGGAVEAEHRAQPADIVIDAASYEALKKSVAVEPVDRSFRLLGIHADLPAPLPFSEPEPVFDVLRVFCPETILHLPIVGEFRQVVNLFVDIPAGITDEALVAPFMETVFELQELYGGYFLRPDVGDKGFNLLMFWGAPVAHETDVDRALNFVLDLSARTRLSLRAGVTYRTAYSGFMGVSLREDYTAYGWGVNLAARLMETAESDEVWLDEEVARRAERHFDIRYLNEMEFKGFAQKQKVFSLVGRKELAQTVYQGDLIGRREELKILADFAAPLRAGRFAGILIVRGEAGIGKSRLIHGFQTSRFFDGFHARWIICQSDEILRASFNPFRDWLRKRFIYSDIQTHEVNLYNFLTELQLLIEANTDTGLSKELFRTSSVLAALLNLHQPGSLYEQLDAKGRYENTFIALSTLFRAESLQRPLVLFIEDIQWLDDDTRAFLPYFVRTVSADAEKQYPIAILATQRSEGEFLSLDRAISFHELNLGKLASNELSHLAEDLLSGSICSSLLELLEQRADGNPFFAEQLLRYLAENGMLFQRQDGCFYASTKAEVSLPMDVRAVLIARLDSLTQSVRETVQTASILGREFEIRLLASMLRNDPELSQKVAHAEHADIWFPLSEFQYIFRHALLRDAAYSMQLLTRQHELHALAVSAMENLYADELEAYYGELAFHSERASLSNKARRYLVLAGKSSAGAYQNSQAIEYFTRALALTPEEDLHTRYDLLLERVELYNRTGDRVSQLRDLEALEDLAIRLHDNEKAAYVWMMRANYSFTIGDYPGTIEIAERSVALAQALGEVNVALGVYVVWSQALYRLGKLDDAMARAKKGLQLARQAGKRVEEGRALTSMGLMALEYRELGIAQSYLEEAVIIARETRERTLESRALGNLANSAAYVQRDYVAARSYYEQAYALVVEQGDRYGQALYLGNLGWVSGMLGDFIAARRYHEQALSVSREVGNLYQAAYTLMNLSGVAEVQGEAQEAVLYATQANELCIKNGDKPSEAWSCLYLGHAYLLGGQVDEAKKAYQQSLEIRTGLGQPALATEPIAGLIQVALRMDEIPLAAKLMEDLMLYLSEGGVLEGTEEPLRVYLACFNILERIKDPRSSAILSTAMQLLEAQVSRFRDEESRRMYIENVPWRRAIERAWVAKRESR